MNRRLMLVLAGALVAASSFLLLWPRPAAPRLSLTDLSQLPVRIAAPYNEKADADADVAAAFARAKASGKRVLVDLGGNWCPDCIVLANVMALPELKPFLEAHFEMVAVDVGRFDRNLQVPARFGLTKRLAGVPTVLIATPDGKLLNPDDPFTLANAGTMSPQVIADWLAKWAERK